MIIESLSLKNYRQYKDVEITFSKDKKNKNFTIIQGANGVGKSNLFNAINWCLYEKEVHLTKEDKTLPLLNTTILKDENLDEVEVEVEIKLREENGKSLIISRRQKFYKNSNGEIKKFPSECQAFMQIGDNMNMVSPDFIRNKKMPESIREYFFFDGERLDDYFKKEGAESIKRSVFEISQIDILEKSISHLGEKSKDFLKNEKDLSPRAEEIAKEIECLSNALEQNKNSLKEKENAVKQGEINFSIIFDQIKNNPVPNSKELKERKFQLEKEITNYGDKSKQLDLDFVEYLLEISPQILLSDALNYMKNTIIEKINKKEFPPGIDKDYLEELLKSKKCICGREISNKDKSEEKIKAILAIINNLSEIGHKFDECDTETEIMLRGISHFKKRYLIYEKDKNDIEKLRENSSKELKKVNEKLSKKHKSFEDYQLRLDEIKEEIGKNREKIGVLRLIIQNSESKIKQKNQELEDELQKEKKFALLRKKLDFCKNCLQELERIKKEIMEETKKEIEEKTKKQFFSLIWNPTEFKDVKIDADYNLSVIHSSNLESLGSLSAGQRQVLALSFIAALNSISGFNLPIIIDTPLGRISKETRANIAEKLPSFLKDKQVILLVTDEEYTNEVRKKLEKNIGQEYEIVLKEYKNGGIANIVKK